MGVLYLGDNVPADSWEKAVRSRAARAAVLSVVTAEDPPALEVAHRLLTHDVVSIVCTGGASGANLGVGGHRVARGIRAAAHELDELLADAEN